MRVLLFLTLLLVFSPSYSQLKVRDESPAQIADTTLVNLKDFTSSVKYDMRYATDNNFLSNKVYDCAECYLRYKTVKGILKSVERAALNGYQLVIFDCYRPIKVQKEMWKIIINPKYVADPAKGSIHNRGGAVDLSLANDRGELIDMGTDFDHFGKEASHSYKNLLPTQISNRKILLDIMNTGGFEKLESEWWHYNLKGANEFKLSNYSWTCN